ncbi:MAG: flagellar assembly protein FliX [Terricaulis sp.]
MKIENGGRINPLGAPRRQGASAASGFAPELDEPEAATATGGLGGVTPLDAVLALQGDDSPKRRRSRQLQRGGQALDTLEQLERGLVLGRAPASLRAELDKLRRRGEATGEPGLDAVLLEIDTRLAVEAAKLDRFAGRA